MPKLWLFMVLAALMLWMATRTENRPLDVLAMMPTPGPAKGNVLVVVDLGQPAVEVPFAFIEEMDKVIACESEYLPVINSTGHRFQAQISPVHFPRMRALGLDPDSPKDTMWYAAYVLWPDQGLGPWESSKGCWME